MSSIKLTNIMKFNNSNKTINSKKRLSLNPSKFNITLPDLLYQNLKKKIRSLNKRKFINQLSYKESENDNKNKNYLKSLSDIENSNNSPEISNYKILFKKKNLNQNNQYLTFNKSKSSFHNSNENSKTIDIEKKNKINLYNNSVKNHSQLYLFNSCLNSSTSIQTSSYRKNPYQKKNLTKSNKNIIHIKLNQNKINQFSSSDNNIIIDNKKTKTSNNSKKKQRIIFMDNKMNLNNNKIDKKENKIMNYSDNKEQFLQKFQNINYLNIKKNKLNNTIKNTIKNIYKYIKDSIEKSNKIENTQQMILKIVITPNDFKSHLMKQNISFNNKIEKSLIKKIKKQTIKKNISNNIDTILVKLIISHTESQLYKKMLKKVLTENIEIKFKYNGKNLNMKKLESLRYNKKYEQNFYFIQERFIKKDLVIKENESSFKRIQIFPEKINISKKFSFQLRKTKKKFSILNNIKLGSSILNRKIFNREGDRINLDRRISYVKKIQLKPSSKVKKIDLEITKLIKNRNMTKEKSVYRTLELKIKLKKELKSIEEILFFLIKENNFQEFKDIQEKFHVSLESRNENNDTFLTYAVQFGYENFIQYLINNGANINAQNNQLNTSLHYALNNKNYKIADILLKEGADETIRNKYNLTPWQYVL